MKQWRGLLLGVIVTVVSLALALQQNDPGEIIHELSRGNYIYIIPGLLILYLALALRAYRWKLLLNNRIDYGHSFNIMNTGYFLNTLLPLRLGEVARSFMTTRLEPPVPMFTSLSSVVVERLSDTLAVVFLVIIAIMIGPVPPEVSRGALTTGILVVAGMALMVVFAVRRDWAHRLLAFVLKLLPFLERFGLTSMMDRVLDGLTPLASLRGAASLLLWTALSWTASVVGGYILMYVFFPEPTWYAALLAIVSAAIAVALPALPGNVGPYEAAVIFGMTAAGLGGDQFRERAFAYAILLHITNVATYVTTGWYGLLRENITLGELIRVTRQLANRSKNNTEAQTTP